MLSELLPVLLLLALIPIDESIQPLQLSLRQFGLSTQQLFLHLHSIVWKNQISGCDEVHRAASIYQLANVQAAACAWTTNLNNVCLQSIPGIQSVQVCKTLQLNDLQSPHIWRVVQNT